MGKKVLIFLLNKNKKKCVGHKKLITTQTRNGKKIFQSHILLSGYVMGKGEKKRDNLFKIYLVRRHMYSPNWFIMSIKCLQQGCCCNFKQLKFPCLIISNIEFDFEEIMSHKKKLTFSMQHSTEFFFKTSQLQYSYC